MLYLRHLNFSHTEKVKRLNVQFMPTLQRMFPINYIRNVALNNTHTPYSIFVDVDLVPGKWMYKDLKDYIMNNQQNKEVCNSIFVVHRLLDCFNDYCFQLVI